MSFSGPKDIEGLLAVVGLKDCLRLRDPCNLETVKTTIDLEIGPQEMSVGLLALTPDLLVVPVLPDGPTMQGSGFCVINMAEQRIERKIPDLKSLFCCPFQGGRDAQFVIANLPDGGGGPHNAAPTTLQVIDATTGTKTTSFSEVNGMIYNACEVSWSDGLFAVGAEIPDPNAGPMVAPVGFVAVFDSVTQKQVGIVNNIDGLQMTCSTHPTMKWFASGNMLVPVGPGGSTGIVRIWDSDLNEIHKVTHEGHIGAIFPMPNHRMMATLSNAGELRLYDERNLSKPLSKQVLPARGSAVQHGPMMEPFRGSFCQIGPDSYVAVQGPLLPHGGHVATDAVECYIFDSMGKVSQQVTGNGSNGVAVVGTAVSTLFHSGVFLSEDDVTRELIDRMELLTEKEDELFDYEVVTGPEGIVTVRLPKAFVQVESGVEISENDEQMVLPDGPAVDPELIRSILFGVVTSISSEELFEYFQFFHLLGMRRHAFLLCQHVVNLAELGTILQLLLRSIEGSGEEVSSPFETVCLNTLKDRLSSIEEDAFLLDRFEEFPGLLERVQAFEVVPLFTLFNLTDEDSSLTFSKLADDLFVRVYEAGVHPSITLRTDSGASIAAHLPVLVARTNWMSKIVEFDGPEMVQYRMDRTMQVSTLGYGGLKGLLQFVYTNNMKSSKFRTLLPILEHACHYTEDELAKTIQDAIRIHSRGFRKGPNFVLKLRPVAHLLTNADVFGQLCQMWVDMGLIDGATLEVLISEAERTALMRAINSKLDEALTRLSRLEQSTEVGLVASDLSSVREKILEFEDM